MATSQNGVSKFEVVNSEENSSLLIKTINSGFKVLVNFSILAINIILFPFVFAYLFWVYATFKTWQIAHLVASAITNLLITVPLMIGIWISTVECFLGFVLMSSSKEVHSKIEDKIYTNIKKILYVLDVLPLSLKHAASLNSVLKKLPIFGQHGLPYPHFLFEDTFTSITYRDGSISVTVPVPQDTPQEPEPATKPSDSSKPALSNQTPASSNETSAPSDQKPASSNQTPAPSNNQTPASSDQNSPSSDKSSTSSISNESKPEIDQTAGPSNEKNPSNSEPKPSTSN